MSWNPVRFFVDQWQFTLLMFALAAAIGLAAFVTIPRSEDPQFPIPIVVVTAVLPGTTPLDMEQQVARPIEDAMNGLDSLKKLSSTNTDGVSVIKVEFGWDADPEAKYDEVVREINALRPTLPQGIARLDVDRQRTSEVAVVQIALVSDILPMRRLEKVADDLRDQLNGVPGIREAKYWGAPPTEVRVAFDPGKLARLQISPTALSDALRSAGAEAPIGAGHAGARRFNLKAGGAFTTLEAVKDVVVASPQGRNVRIGDIADVSWEQDEPQHITRFNGRRAVFVTATAKDGEDVTRINGEVSDLLETFERTLPASVSIARGFDQAENINARLGRLYRDFAIALTLVLITLIPLGIRAGVIVAISIPLSLLVGLAGLQYFGFTLNQLSISGLILSLGLLVDDAIVVTENIARHLRAGADRVTAAIAGTNQVALAVAGSTACLIFSFLPLLALPESSGAYVKSLPVAVLATVGASFFVALTIIPFLASRLLPRAEPMEGNRVLQAINSGIQRFYAPVLHRSLERPWQALGLLFALCLLAVPMVAAIGSSLFPPAETPQFLIRIQSSDGASLKTTDRALRFVETTLAKVPEVDWVASNLGRGNPTIFYNQPQRETNPAFAEAYVSLREWVPGESDALLDRLRDRFATFGAAQISVIAFENGPQIDAPIAIRVSGSDLATLKSLSAAVEAQLRATPGTRDIINPLRVDRTDYNLGLDEARAASLGVPAGVARRTARLALSGEDAARFRDGDGDDYPVRVRLPLGPEQRHELDDLAQIEVPSASGASVPFAAIASPFLESSPARIDRYDRLRSVTVTSQVKTGALTSAVTQDALERINGQIDLPSGYRIALGGQAEAQSAGFAGLGVAILITVFGLIGVLVLEFRKFRTALVVAGIIPFGLLGAVAALFVTGNSLSFTAAIGMVALLGIEIKNSILLVDFAEQLRRDGMPLRQAIERSGEVRFLPVLLTSLTAIGGLLPLAVENSGLYSPLAIAIIGGLITSTLLSRVATPVMYWLVSRGEDAALAVPQQEAVA